MSALDLGFQDDVRLKLDDNRRFSSSGRQASLDQRMLKGRITLKITFCDIFAPVNITQLNQHRL